MAIELFSLFVFELLQNFKENIEVDDHNLRVSADKSIDPCPRIPPKRTTRSVNKAILLKNCFSLSDWG